MPTTTDLKQLVINTVESQEVYDYLKTNGLINEDEIYLVAGMRKDFAKAASKGTVIKNENFVTARGVYQIIFVRYENDIYFFKHQNGQLVECCNLSNLGNNQDKTSMA